MRINVSHIFAIGDIDGQSTLAHKAVPLPMAATKVSPNCCVTTALRPPAIGKTIHPHQPLGHPARSQALQPLLIQWLVAQIPHGLCGLIF
jgi:hypothetical protein